MSALRLSELLDPLTKVAIAIGIVVVAAAPSCGGGGSNVGVSGATNPPPPVVSSAPNLTESDVNTIVLQAMHEASAEAHPVTVAIVDRVGNVLTVAQMSGAPATVTVTSGRGVPTTQIPPPPLNGLEGVSVPSTLAAIAKALTGAYLSSNGNAFSTRTANHIIQEHFNPGVHDAAGGPLFGVQFSQLPCSDFNTVAAPAGAVNAGPHRSPLGFSADPGGLPIYKNGLLVGGIGVMGKTTYSGDLNINDVDHDPDEIIALAGVTGFAAPATITAPNISVGGNTLRYTDATTADFKAPVAATGTFAPVTVTGYFNGPAAGHTAVAGLTYGSTDGASGIAPDGALGAKIYPAVSAFVFTDGAGHVLYTPKAGVPQPGNVQITATEAQQLMTSALQVAFRTRAQIRMPLNSHAEVTITITDIDGNVLAQARTPDAPIFGADVSRQKARGATFFSRTDAAAKIIAIAAPASTQPGTFADYITRSRTLSGDPTIFSDGLAWSEVAIGNLARPFYPDGIDGNGPGSLSLPFSRWSVFSTGLQTDLVVGDIVRNGVLGAPPPATGCAATGPSGEPELPLTASGKTELANGLQIFSGSVPIYRGSTLVGGIGVSGDGIQQDSLVSFLGLQNGPATLNNAPSAIRADQIAFPDGTRVRYINCPFGPFLDTSEQNPC